jgi:hypothetical protein
MQLRRFLIAVVLLTALAALGWFAAHRTGASNPGLSLPTPQSTSTSAPAPAAVLDGTASAPNRVAEAQRAEPREPDRSAGAEMSAQSHDEQGNSGLLVRVLDPSGHPLPGALISYFLFGDGPFTVGMPHPTDANGCWHFRVGPGRKVDLRATYPTNRFAPAYAFNVGPEPQTLEMRLETTTAHTLLVVDDKGVPIERFAWRLLDQHQYVSRPTGKIELDVDGRLRDTQLRRPETGSFAPTEKDQQAHAGGRVELHIGSLAFAVQVDADDFEQAQAGPFPASDAPSEIRVVLQRLPGIRGRVVHEGKGVPGAWVKLHRAPRGERAIYVNGFPSRSQPWAVAESKTDEEGRFKLQLRQTDDYLIRAGAAGLCMQELGPRRFEVHQGADELEIVLPAAGTIEGRILLAKEETQTDWIIGASRGDGMARSVHTDAEGRFRFESLSPGEWILRPSEADLDPERIEVISDAGDSDPPIPATCVVHAGETTQVEFDLRVKVVLAAGYVLPGWEKAKCSCALEATGDTFSRRERLESIQPGSLRAVVDQPGNYRLRLTLLAADGRSNLGIAEDVRLESGENAWTFEYPFGELVLVNTLDVEQWATLRCDLEGTRRSTISVNLVAHESHQVTGLPVARWVQLKRVDGIEREGESIELVRGSSVRMELR